MFNQCKRDRTGELEREIGRLEARLAEANKVSHARDWSTDTWKQMAEVRQDEIDRIVKRCNTEAQKNKQCVSELKADLAAAELVNQPTEVLERELKRRDVCKVGRKFEYLGADCVIVRVGHGLITYETMLPSGKITSGELDWEVIA